MFHSKVNIRQKYLKIYLVNGESSKEGWRRLTPRQTPIITFLNVSLPSRRTRARWTQNKQRTMRKATVLHNISILEDAVDFFEGSFARSSCCFGFASTSERCKTGPVFSVKSTAILVFMAVSQCSLEFLLVTPGFQVTARIKTRKKSLGLPTKPQKSLGPKINPPKNPCQISEPLKIPKKY